MSQEQLIASYQPILQAIALKIVDSIHDAEDIVQDTFLKWFSVDHKEVQNPKAYLIRSVTNNCLNHINSIRQKKKEYLESVKLPEFFDKIDLSHLDFKQEMEQAFALLYKKLEPLERAVFILREGFGCEYDELQEIFNKKKDHCRQIVSRARQKLSGETSKINVELEIKGNFFETFKNAFSTGYIGDLIDYFKSNKLR